MNPKAFYALVRTKSKKYPFWCKGSEISPRPEYIHHSEYGHFIRLPFSGYAYWGFQTRTARDTFASKYNAEAWSHES